MAFGSMSNEDILAQQQSGGADDFRDPVLDKDLTSPPPGPHTLGDRYIVAKPATGGWIGHGDDIAQWNGLGWDFETPSVGWIIFVIDEGVFYVYTGPTLGWVSWGATIDHNTLLNLGPPNDAHLQYALLTGRAGGQNLIGSTLAGQSLSLESTSHVSKGKVIVRDNLVPPADDQKQVGEAGRRFTAIYTNDLVTGDLNLQSSDGQAHWTMIEQSDAIILINRKNNKRYRMVLEEVSKCEEENKK